MSDIPFDSTGEPAASNINFDKVSVKQPLPIVPQNFPPIIPPFSGGVVQSSGAPFSFPLQASLGGTGFGSFAIGDILYADSTSTLARLPVSTNGFVLTLDAGLPKWAAISAIGVIGGSGTAGKIPKFATAFTIGDSILSEAGGLITVTGNLAATGLTASNYVRTDASKVLVSVATIPSADISNTSFVTSVTGTANRITATAGLTPIIDISASYVGQASITTLGTIATGTWNGTAIGTTFGGTGLTSYTSGSILYASASNVLSALAASTNGFILTLVGGFPSWATPVATIGGSGTIGTIPKFTAGTTIGNSIITETTGPSAIEIAGNLSVNGTDGILVNGFINIWANGLDSTFVGRSAGLNNNIPSAGNGIYNTFIGSSAGRDNTSGYAQTFVGFAAGVKNTIGNVNTFLGYQAGSENISGNQNVYVGGDAGFGSTNSDNNVIVGFHAGLTANPATGGENVYIGSQSGPQTGSSGATLGTMVGYRSGYSLTSGNANSTFGNVAGFALSSGGFNSLFGFSAGTSASTGVENSFFGSRAGYGHTTGDYSTAVGANSLFTHSGTGVNTALGHSAGFSLGANGAGGLFLGYQAGYHETGNDKLYIDNRARSNEADGRTKALIYGVFDASVTNQFVTINGSVGIGTSSFGASMTLGLVLTNGVAPSGGVTDCFQMYSADIVDGNAAPHFRTELGSVIKLFKSAAYTPTNVSNDRSYDANATTLDEVADVLGTLIADLQATGLIG